MLEKFSIFKSKKKEFLPGISTIRNLFFNKLFGSTNDFPDKYKGWTYRSISLIAQEISSANLRLYKKVKGKNDEEISDHELLKLWERPNPEMTKSDILEHISSSLDLDGNAYLYKAKAKNGTKTLELWPLRADWVKVMPSTDKTKLIDKFIYFNGAENTDLEVSEVIHIKNYNPKYFDKKSTLKGVGTVEAALDIIKEDETIREWNRKFFENGAITSGVLEYDGTLEEDQKKRIESGWRKNFEGTDNSSKTPILAGGLHYKPNQFSQRELAFIDQRKLDRDDTFLMFGIHKGVVMSEDVNLANAKTALWSFTRFTIRPRLKKIEAVLNKDLTSEYGSEFYLEFDNPVPEDRAEIVNEYAQGFNKWLTTNDIRREEGLEELDGGDEIRVNQPIMPVIDPNTDKNHKKCDCGKHKSSEKDESNQDERTIRGEKAWGEMIKIQTPYEDKYKSAFKKYFFSLREKVIKNLSEKSIKTKAVIDEAVEVSTVFDLLTPLQRELLEKSGKQALKELGLENDFVITPSIAKVLDKYDLKLSRSIGKTTQSDLEEIIANAGDEGLGVNELTGKINEYFDFADEVRAERIARSETIRTSNQAMQDAWIQSEIVESKEWYTAGDERTCEMCAEMDGKIVGLDENYFDKGAEFMGLSLDFRDIGEPPLHCSCRCTLLPVIKQ